MSTMVRVGHILAVILLAVFGVWMLVISARQTPELIRGLRQPLPVAGPGEAVGYFISASFVAWIPALICAWGILRWRRWALFLTIPLLALGILSEVSRIVLHGSAHWADVGGTVLALLMVLWLLLPSVRLQFKD